jgi:hypothetical protein
VTKRINILIERVKAGALSPVAATNVLTLVKGRSLPSILDPVSTPHTHPHPTSTAALAKEWDQAIKIHTLLVQEEYEHEGKWLPGMKRIIELLRRKEE